MSLSRHDREAACCALGWILATSLLVGLALAASCVLGCGARLTWGSAPGVAWPIDDAPARHSDGGAP